MSSHFKIKTKMNVSSCVSAINHFSIDFGFSKYDASILSTAVSEASINAVRYANGAEVLVTYTKNNLGIQIDIIERYRK